MNDRWLLSLISECLLSPYGKGRLCRAVMRSAIIASKSRNRTHPLRISVRVDESSGLELGTCVLAGEAFTSRCKRLLGDFRLNSRGT